MTIFIQNNATGAGAGSVDPQQAFVDLLLVANLDTGLGLAAVVGNRQAVTYARTDPGIPPTRLDNLVNTNFTPDYGVGPQAVNIVILSVLSNFTLNDGALITTVGGTALAPQNSGLAGAPLNNTNDCLVIYDTTQNNSGGFCTARAGTGGTLDLQTPNEVILYHELSHALRIVTNALLSLSSAGCNPSSPEENAAITDENDLRTQRAVSAGIPVVLRDPAIHCGAVCAGGSTVTCCIIASVSSGSPLSVEVNALRSIRDGLLRKGEIGFAFFHSLHYDYYGFSPQVCTLMARYPALKSLVLEGFVRPLVTVFHVIKQYALGESSAAALGEQFSAEHADQVTSAARLNIMRRAHEILNGGGHELTQIEHELTQLLSPALNSQHVSWAILEPIQFYYNALQAHTDGGSSEQIGKQLHNEISLWAVRMPLDDVWASLAVSELQYELQMLESLLFHTPELRADFHDRLQREFSGVTAIRVALGERI